MIMFAGEVYRRGMPNLHDGNFKSFGNLAAERSRELKELEKWELTVNKRWRLILSRIWSTSKKSTPCCDHGVANPTTVQTLVVQRTGNLIMGAEISMEMETGSSHKQEMRRVSRIKFLQAGRRRSILLSRQLRSLILSICRFEGRVMQITTWFIKKVMLATYFQEKKDDQDIGTLRHHHDISGRFGGG